MKVDGWSIAWWIACITIVVGAILPWARVGVFEVTGTQGDGQITLVLAFIGLGISPPWTTRISIAAYGRLVVAGLVGIIGVYDYFNVSRVVADSQEGIFAVSVGEGLYFTIAGAVLGLVASGQEVASRWEQLPGTTIGSSLSARFRDIWERFWAADWWFKVWVFALVIALSALVIGVMINQ